ncbi:MAG: hypothetical protein H8K08_07270 [Nitrospira sp.]|nr:hypothetical protein [Nitrospira sp.]
MVNNQANTLYRRAAARPAFRRREEAPCRPHKLVSAGNTLVVTEHNLNVIKSADWVIDLGPEGGAAGGQIIAEGRPKQIAKAERSHTGRFLFQALSEK